MLLSQCWMTGCVAMEMNTGPDSLAFKIKHAVYLDIKEIRRSILGKLNKCYLLPVFWGDGCPCPWRCVSR